MNPSPSIDDPVVVGGLLPLTTIDYPDQLAAVIFLQGCPWKCAYCQNGSLLNSKAQETIPWSEVIDLLKSRQGFLDAVVFSGGEPTMQSGLIEAISQVKSLGYKVGLHSAGIYPKKLKKILPLVDWIGLDVKSTIADYSSITQVKGSGERAWECVQMVLESGVDYEFRTTIHPDLLSKIQLTQLTQDLTNLGAKNLVLQQCITDRCFDINRTTPLKPQIDPAFLTQLGDQFEQFSIRNS